MELSTAALRLAAVLALALLVSPALAGAAPKTPVYDSHGNLIETPFVPQDKPAPAMLTERQAIAAVLADDKVSDWVGRYPAKGLTKEATFDDEAGSWSVKVWSDLPDAGQIVDAKVDDATGEVTEAWTGPQVAWKMARGYKGAFGRAINDPWIWLTFCVVFLLGLADFRRLVSVRNLDLLVLLSFSISLYYFNAGDVFTAVPLVYPPLAYLLGRMLWIGARGRGSASRPLWPAWVLLAATVFLLGFRVGLNVQDSNVIDVGLAGIDGGQRIVQGEMPYGHMPTDDGKACGPADSEGYVREHVQTNGRCESANERGDTYGPFSYLGYVPAYLMVGFDGKWNGGSSSWEGLPAAHLTAILWDVVALVGMGLLGLRFGGRMLGATLAFAWAAYPFTQYVSSSNSNDAIMPALLVWGLVFLTSPPARGLFLGLAAWTKFAALLLLPLWASYRDWRRDLPGKLRFVGGFVLATALSFWILLLEPDPLHAARVFWDRTFGWQLSRPSPFSIWDWDEYPGFPDLHHVQTALKIVLLVGAVAVYFVPRVKSELQLAALSAALVIGFELVLTHWFYLYLPWFFPFAAFALLAPALLPAAAREPAAEPSELEHEPRALVSTR
ncbi:MAG TPA: hypothetical protein VFW80_00640 [Gaiellaceae bacterium]|nr:hypothetical protein [Gaiellaceae bacterium]